MENVPLFRTSGVWHILNEEGKRWHCTNLACMSPIFQWSWDGFEVCNGCLRKSGTTGSKDVIPTTETIVYPDDLARDPD